jgi:hypothetical protein
MSRHGRQTRLAEVGSAGQARIASSTVDVALEGLAGEVATRYLAGAGAGCVRVGPADGARLAAIARSIDPAVRVEVVEFRSASHEDGLELRHPGARDVALGARLALRALRGALGMVELENGPVS